MYHLIVCLELEVIQPYTSKSYEMPQSTETNNGPHVSTSTSLRELCAFLHNDSGRLGVCYILQNVQTNEVSTLNSIRRILLTYLSRILE